jgi:putative transposase
MSKEKKEESVPLDTIWEMPDEAWDRLKRIIEAKYPPSYTGRPRTDLRKAVNGIIYRMRTGCQWNKLPKIFGDDSSVHRWFQRMARDGIFETLWGGLILECEELQGVNWEWQSADCCSGKSRFEGEKRGLTRQTEASREPRKASLSKRMAGPLG